MSGLVGDPQSQRNWGYHQERVALLGNTQRNIRVSRDHIRTNRRPRKTLPTIVKTLGDRRKEFTRAFNFRWRHSERMKAHSIVAALLLVLATIAPGFGQESAPLPGGVKAVWDVGKAYRETTPTRERICLNGLWRWQPVEPEAQQPPAGLWGFFKVPGSWPRITDYMQKDSQTVFAHPAWKPQNLGGITAAWYEREFTVPASWAGRSIAISAEYLNSYATVFVDGKKAGEMRFPGGELDLTALCKPGGNYRLSIHVVALPIKGIMLSYTDSASAREVKGSVPRRGLCGDVFLVSKPSGSRITEIGAETSFRKEQITVRTSLENLAPAKPYSLRARILDGDRAVKEFTGRSFSANDLTGNRLEFNEKWMPEKLWDIHTPQNVYALEVSLLDAAGQVVDVHWKSRLGFRELWIDGRDFYLNGKRIHLSAVPLDNASIGAALSTYQAARESLERLKSFGINFVYTHNYDCLPGSHLSFSEILRAADDVGMLVALTQPHFSHYDWKAADVEEKNGYALHAAFYARVAQEHPSVVMYSMSHNATGYEEDMNPDLIDGIHDPRDTWSARNAKVALRAEAIVKRLDPSRIVYHHASGNLGSMHPINFYPNFVPIQELSDWFEHWAMEGVKPAFLCEFGAPFTWDWTMYRGWYKGQREFGSAKVPWEFCVAEWNAQFFGDRAYAISEAEKANLRWEAKQFRAGNLWHRWDYPNSPSSSRLVERYPLFAKYITDNWRAFRTWGVSAISPWEHEHFWRLRDGVDKRRLDFQTDWENLQQPGFSPDYNDQSYERMDLAFKRSDWIATPAAEALLRNNRPLLAYIAGKPDHFTSKDHNFLAGETMEKQIIVINDSREPIRCESRWSIDLPNGVTGSKAVTVEPGGQQRIPIRFELPKNVPAGRYEVKADFSFGNGEEQADSFSIDVLPAAQPANLEAKIALFDPKGETKATLDKLGLRTMPIEAGADLSAHDIVIVGKGALTLPGRELDLSRVRMGLKVIVFEQTAEVLEKKLGFRVEEYGLRNVFARIPDHPLLAGLKTESLSDWRGEATILPSRLKYTVRPRYGPTVDWCGIPVTRLWRCGNRGNVASVLIEKPARGDFLPIVDGGYALQYSPLLEYREGRGMIVFCQLDVIGRTESEPAAAMLIRNLVQYVANWRPAPARTALYVGDDPGRRHLESIGVKAGSYAGGKLSSEQVLVVGPGGGRELAAHKAEITASLKSGGHLLALGLDQAGADAFFPAELHFKQAEHIATFFEPNGGGSIFRGIGPPDVHNRDPREFPLVASGATTILGDGVLAAAGDGSISIDQMPPWQFDAAKSMNLKRTFRRAAFTLTRLLANLDVPSASPLLSRFNTPVDVGNGEKRWLSGAYLDQPEEWDDPYRHFRW